MLVWRQFLSAIGGGIYQIKRWDESNSPIEECCFAKQAHEAKKWAFVADYVRLYALYNEGGIYLDTDMLILKPLDPLLHHSCFLGFEEPGYVNCAIAGAVPRHPYIEEMLQRYESRSFDTTRIIGIPKMCSDALTEKGLTSEDVFQEVFGVHIYPTDYFYPYPFRIHIQQKDLLQKNFMSYVTSRSYAVHLWNWSWKSVVDCLKHGQYKEGLWKLWQEIRQSPNQTLKKIIRHSMLFFSRCMRR